MATIRAYRAGDLEDLYRVCLLTGWAGEDATGRYADPRLLGDVYAAPYGVLQPDCAFVIEDEAGVGGYMLGAPDTAAFEARLEAEWWPLLRTRHPEPRDVPRETWTADQALIHRIHHPLRMPAAVTEPYPAHLHIDLLPRFQGRGFGRALIDRWIEHVKSLGARGVHFGVAAANSRARRFYSAYGFQEIWVGPGDSLFAKRFGR
jgi:GNAT superfamily N-acetyltransferase